MRPVFRTTGRFVEKPRAPMMLLSNGQRIAPSLVYDFLQSADPIIPAGLTTTKSISANETYVNSAGLITQGAANVWPLDYSPSTLQPLGRPVWEARTNLLLQSTLPGGGATPTGWSVGISGTSAPTSSIYGSGTAPLHIFRPLPRSALLYLKLALRCPQVQRINFGCMWKRFPAAFPPMKS